MKKAAQFILFNGINFLFLYCSVSYILSTEIDLLHPSKWLVYLVSTIMFIGWVFLCSVKLKKLAFNKYIYISTFLLLNGIVVLFSNNIVSYQHNKNFEEAKVLVSEVEKGKRVSGKYYLLGLSYYRFEFQEKEGKVTSLIFKGKAGTFHKYDFKHKKWVLFD